MTILLALLLVADITVSVENNLVIITLPANGAKIVQSPGAVTVTYAPVQEPNLGVLVLPKDMTPTQAQLRTDPEIRRAFQNRKIRYISYNVVEKELPQALKKLKSDEYPAIFWYKDKTLVGSDKNVTKKFLLERLK